jgi:phosphoserine phosphatase RsbU/P
MNLNSTIHQSYDINGVNVNVRQLIEELKSLRQEVVELKIEKAALQAQGKLLEHLVTRTAHGFVQEEMVKAVLEEVLDVCSQLVGVDKGRLFLLDRHGAVTNSILIQREAMSAEPDRLIGQVLTQGLAGWVCIHRQLELIFDTETDDRCLQLPYQSHTVRSALAVPIVRGEELLGILTLLHQKPGHFTPQAVHLTQVTAEQIARVLEDVQLHEKIEIPSCKVLSNDLEEGRQIQGDFLPDEIPQILNSEIATFFSPARQVAGDFYDFFLLPDDYVGLAIGDVVDKGVGAAMFMALFRSLLRVFSGQSSSLSKGNLSIVARGEEFCDCLDPQMEIDIRQLNALKAVVLTNNYIAQQHSHINMFATLFFGVLNTVTGSLAYINGGHEPLFIVGESGIKTSLEHTGPAVGMMPEVDFKIQQVYLEPGDFLIGYTDGVTEARAPDGQFFTDERLRSLLAAPATSAAAMIKRIEADLFSHIGDASQSDDITMLALHWKAQQIE